MTKPSNFGRATAKPQAYFTLLFCYFFNFLLFILWGEGGDFCFSFERSRNAVHIVIKAWQEDW